jgi:hypothetical protein
MTSTIAWLDWLPLAIAALALVSSFLFGLSSRRTARRALALSERIDARRAPELDLYLSDSVAWRFSADDARLIGLHVQVANPSDRPGALVGMDLHVTYAVDGQLATLKVPHGGEMTHVLTTGLDIVELPRRLEANDAFQGWFLFYLAGDLTGRHPVDRYDVVATDVRGVVAELQITAPREVADGEA